MVGSKLTDITDVFTHPMLSNWRNRLSGLWSGISRTETFSMKLDFATPQNPSSQFELVAHGLTHRGDISRKIKYLAKKMDNSWSWMDLKKFCMLFRLNHFSPGEIIFFVSQFFSFFLNSV